MEYYRTLLQGILEQYWYDPLLADHFDVDIEEVICSTCKDETIL